MTIAVAGHTQERRLLADPEEREVEPRRDRARQSPLLAANAHGERRFADEDALRLEPAVVLVLAVVADVAPPLAEHERAVLAYAD